MFYDNDYNILFSDFSTKALTSTNKAFYIILNNDYMETSPLSSSMSVNSLNTNALVKNTDIKSLPLNIRDLITVNSTQYFIKNILYNEKGISEIELQNNA